jgi:hypothetical protein
MKIKGEISKFNQINIYNGYVLHENPVNN